MVKINISNELYDKIMNFRKDNIDSFEENLNYLLDIYFIKYGETKKLVFLGEAGVGKTTLRKLFFEYNDPKILSSMSFEPTKSLEFYEYDLYGSKLSVVDTSGQELDSIIEDEKNLIFSEVDHVIYMIDAQYLKKDSKIFQKSLVRIKKIQKSNDPNMEITIFIHKIDLLSKSELSELKKRLNGIKFSFQSENNMNIRLEYTSIMNSYLTILHITILKILSKLGK